MEEALIIPTILYLSLIVVLAVFAKKNIRNEKDFIAAGRRLPTVFASATLFATWFGAGTLLTATDAIYDQGIAFTALEPFGAGSCLLLAGACFAVPLWKMNILTVPDLFGVKFGKRAEIMAAILLVPGYFGWIAVQITALSGIIHMFFGLDLVFSMVAVTVFATTLACFGGMWSITITDFVQMIFVLVVIAVLAYVVLLAVGKGDLLVGISQIVTNANTQHAQSQFSFGTSKIFYCANLFIIAAFGNLPGQDLAQRIFSANSAKVARRSCLVAGIFYVVFGSISILLGIAARSILPEAVDHSVIPHLAKHVLSPWLTGLLILAIISIIISTMDSAMLAASSIISHNLLKPRLKTQAISVVTACRLCVAVVAFFSLLLAFVGESAYSLLEQSYAISLAGLFAPFAIGLFMKSSGHEWAAMVSMAVGILIWSLGFVFAHVVFSEIAATIFSFIAYFITSHTIRASELKNMMRA